MTLVDLLEEYGVQFVQDGHQHCRPGWVQADCPECSPGQQRYRLGINLEGGYANCWSCGYVHLPTALAEITGESYGTIKDRLKDLTKVSFQRTRRRRGKLIWPEGFGPLTKRHRNYLRKRKLDPFAVERIWGLKGSNFLSPLPWRILVPVVLEGEVASWTTRTIFEKGLRYVSADDEQSVYPLQTLLLGEDFVRHTIIVVEGPFDAMRIGPGACALMGAGFGMARVRRIAQFPRRVVCLDGDEGGLRQGKKLTSLLEAFPGETYHVQLESAKDPGAATEREINQLRRFLK